MKLHSVMYFLRITYDCIINTTIHTLLQNEEACFAFIYVCDDTKT